MIDPALFRATLLREVRAAWETLRGAHAGQAFYGFGVYTTDVVDYLMVTASTEEGLAAAGVRYGEKTKRDPALCRTMLRWSFGDSPLHAEGEGLLPESDRLRGAGPDPYEDSAEARAAIELVFAAVVEALRALDAEGVFGVGEARARLTLGIWKGDQSDEERVEFARQLNPPAVAERFARELEEANEAFLVVYPDC